MRLIIRCVKIVIVVALTCAIAVLAVPIIMRAALSPYMYVSSDDVPKAQVAIVPGASVVHGKPSPILANRADAAIKLYNKGKVSKILVTGDSADVSHDEVTPVRDYLLEAGIPARDIFLDPAGFDTYSSIYRTIHVFDAQSATIVTQDFHLPRALWIARRLGLDAYGVVALGQGGFVNGYLREIPASIKALWDFFAYRQPDELGISTPLTGDGRDTWQ